MCCSACCSSARVPAFAADTCAAFRTGARLLPEFYIPCDAPSYRRSRPQGTAPAPPLDSGCLGCSCFLDDASAVATKQFAAAEASAVWQVCEQLLTPRAGSDEGQARGYSLRLPWCCKSGARRTRCAVRPTRPSAGSVYTLQLRGTAAPLACTAAHSAIHS